MASPGTVPTTAVADDRTVPASSKLAQDRVRTHDEAHEIDLTDVLGDLKTPTVAAPERPAPENLDQVFEDKRSEAVATPEADQSTQYIQLANTYLELDMVDEAISALETAVRSPRQRFAAASVLGRLHMRRGAHAVAIEWLERAAEAPAPSVEEAHALLYDLGVLLDEAGETARALALFLELQAEADDYRDVAVRIDRLTRVQTGG
jgi:tetratricopeptide (TPR) repeat protein